MCTSAACGGSDMRRNAAAATPTAPPACPPASCMHWGLWWGLEPSLGARGGPEGRQGGGSGGGLLVLVLMLLQPVPCCARSCSSQDVPPRCQQLLWGLVWLNCGWGRPSKLRGGCGGAVHGHRRWGLRWGMRRGDGVCVGHGAWGVAVALVESVGDLVVLGCCFSLPVVASFAPGGGLLWVPRWSAGSPNHDGLSAAFGCTPSISFAPATSPLALRPPPSRSDEGRRDSCLLAACCKCASTDTRWSYHVSCSGGYRRG